MNLVRSSILGKSAVGYIISTGFGFTSNIELVAGLISMFGGGAAGYLVESECALIDM